MAVDRKSDIPKSKTFLKRLISAVGYSRAMDLVLTGRDLNTKEAFECGLANRIVACGSGMKIQSSKLKLFSLKMYYINLIYNRCWSSSKYGV